MPEATPEAKVSFAEFLAKVPDAPSSAVTHDEEAAAPEAETPKASRTSPTAPAGHDAEEAAASPPPTPESKSAAPANVDSASITPDLEAVRAALKAGDLDTLGELLGEDPALYDEKTPKWAARKRKEHALEERAARITAKAEAVVQRWAPIADLTARIDAGEVHLVPELLQLLTNKDPDGLWLSAVRARSSTDPRVPQLTATAEAQAKRLAELEAERAARADQAFYETLRDEVARDSVVRKIDGWEAKVATVLRDSVDPDLGEPKLSIKQACDRVIRREREEFEKRAAVFGGERPAPKPRGKAPERASGASGAKVRKLTRDEWLAARSNG